MVLHTLNFKYIVKASPGGITHVCGQFDLVRRNGTAHTNYSPGFCFNIPPPASVCKEGNSADCPTAAVKHSFEGKKKKKL